MPHLRLFPLLRWRDWAPDATHFLAPDDDAYPFVDRIVAELISGAVLSCSALRGEGRAERVALQKTFVWGYFMYERPARRSERRQRRRRGLDLDIPRRRVAATRRLRYG